MFIARKITVGRSSCLRIVDFFGIDFIESPLAEQFQNLLTSEGSEYIDFMVSGIADNVIKRLGFVECSNENYVPHLFEPFVRDARKVQFAVSMNESNERFIVFKGDSDLDRPNS